MKDLDIRNIKFMPLNEIITVNDLDYVRGDIVYNPKDGKYYPVIKSNGSYFFNLKKTVPVGDGISG
ncbi:MAG TPA: hypothetical protein VFM99_07620 [Chitinophagales bacterium]|nr:hypothetical protein [Chitinophagales bacterium]